MRAAQRELGLTIVVEEPAVPAVRVVALCALRPEPRFVNVLARMAGRAGGLHLAVALGHVAILARRQLVQGQQRELREAVIKANSSSPSIRTVTRPTIPAEIALVDVDRRVTVRAAGRSRLHVHLRDVAEIAGHLAVASLEPILRVAAVVEMRRLPGARIVAVVAAGASKTVVIVVEPMAALAVHRDCTLLGVGFVTLLTPEIGVSSLQREAGVPAVVEASLLPARRIVAGLASRPETASMDVVHAVARDAVHRRSFETIARMAGAAVRLGVQPLERKAGRGVIESKLPPGERLMAALALLAQLALVRIGIAVAGHAAAVGLTMSLPIRVAARAGQSRMGPFEGEVGPIVIEGLGQQTDDVGIGTLVFSVTDPALTVRLEAKAPVEALAPLHVSADFLVAVKTETVLRILIEALVTSRALLRFPSVGCQQRPWRNEVLEIDRPRNLHRAQCQKHDDDRCCTSLNHP